MKRTVRKWLSLLMAFAIVLSLMPVALAESETPPTDLTWSGGNNEGENRCTHTSANSSEEKAATCTKTGERKWTCDSCGATATETIKVRGHDMKEDENESVAATCTKDGKTVKKCNRDDCDFKEEETVKATGHKASSSGYTHVDDKNEHKYTCEDCKEEITEACGVPTSGWTATTSGHKWTCEKCNHEYTGEHDYKESGKCKFCDAANDRAAYSIGGSMEMKVDDTKNLEFTFYDKYGVPTTDSIRNLWYEVDSRYDDCVSIASNGKIYAEYAGTARIIVYNADGESLGYVSIRVTGTSRSDFTVTASVSADSSGYALGDTDDDNGSSIIAQINKKLKNDEWIDDIWFTTVSHTNGKLNADKGSSTSDRYAYSESGAEEVVFTPDRSAKKGDTAVFYATVYAGRETKKYYDVTISIKIIDGNSSGSDIEYNATAGKNVTFDSDDFEAFWKDNRRSSWKDLDYVTFSTPTSSTGVLYDGDGTKLKNSTKCYVSAGRNQVDLDDVYFEPKSSKAGTVKINFTAVGESDHEIDGTVVITYLNGNIDDITYTTNSSGKVDLKAKDFTDVFKAATGSSSSSLTITFTSLPSNGTLTYGSKDTKVTKSTTFKTSGTGNKIADVTYTASGSKSDTVTYTAASGSTKITGKILFNSVAANISLTVPYTCTSASGITFSTGDFTSRASGLTGSHSLAFGQPSGGNGGLYYTAIASQIPAGTKIPVSTLNTVTYRPSSNGATTIAFIIYDASGLVAGSGSVTITVSGVTGGTANPGNPGNPGTTTPGGVDSFKDVNATAWYRTDLTRLVSLGIMAGRSPNKFAPEGTLNYGEALKLICKAVGVTQPEGSGAQWAANYKSYAVSQGWITSDVVLTDTITRTAIAQIGAKALGLSASSATPFPDTNDPYVAAMNTAGIILGNPDGNFNGSGNLKRSEICAIICRMLNYRDNAYNDQIPGWL